MWLARISRFELSWGKYHDHDGGQVPLSCHAFITLQPCCETVYLSSPPTCIRIRPFHPSSTHCLA